MKLLSFYFDPVLSGDRLDALEKIIFATKPEFLAFQNVTNDNIKTMKRSTWGTRYNVIHPPYRYETRMKPTVALFSTYALVDREGDSVTIEYHETNEDRVMQKGYYTMYDKENKPFVICVGSTVLEQDLKVSETREHQLNEACLSMKGAENAFLMGNLGIDNDIDGEVVFQQKVWKDAWLHRAGNTESNGYTYHPEKNPLIKADPFGPGRPDRLLFKSRNYSLESVKLVGMEPYQPSNGPAVTVSKHYGILAHFQPLDAPKPKEEAPLVSAYFKRSEWSVKFQETGEEDQSTENQSEES